jgi:seryl-tRNA synthetase
VLGADAAERDRQRRVESLRARQNAASKDIGKAAPDDRPAKIAAAGALKEELNALERELAEADATLRALALQLPNPADASVPDGGEDDGEVVRTVGDTTETPALDHAAFGEAIGFVNAERGAEVSGSRFAYVMREAVLIELALLQWVMGILAREGFAPVSPRGPCASTRRKVDPHRPPV